MLDQLAQQLRQHIARIEKRSSDLVIGSPARHFTSGRAKGLDDALELLRAIQTKESGHG